MIENLIYLLFIVVAIAVLGLLCYLLMFVAGFFEEKENKKQSREEIRKEFKSEINALRNDDGVYFEEYEREAM